MTEQRADRADRNDERVEDLEVRGDEAREIAGGKKGAKKGGQAQKKIAADAKRFHGRDS